MRSRLLIVALVLLAVAAWLLLRAERPSESVSSRERGQAPVGVSEAPSLTGMRREVTDVSSPPPNDPGPEGSRPGPERRAEPDVPTVVVRGVVRLRGTDRVAVASSVSIQGEDASEGTTTDEKGTYAVRLPRGTKLHSAGVWPAREQALHLMTSVSLGDRVLEDDLTLDLEVEPGLTLSGRVVDAETGAPLDAAVVRFDSVANGTTWIAAAAGSFVLSGIDPDDLYGRTSCWIWAECPGYARERVEVGIDRRNPTTSGIRVALRRGVTISGRVVVPEGHSADRLPVRVEERLPGDSGWGRAVRVLGRTETDAGGAFVLSGLPPTAKADLLLMWMTDLGGGFGLGDALRDLDLRVDRSDLVLRPAAAGYAMVGATYPDGSRAGGAGMEVVFRDPRGVTVQSTMSADEARFVTGAVGERVLFDVYANGRVPANEPGSGRVRLYRGRGVVTMREGLPDPEKGTDIVVALEEVSRPNPPWGEDPEGVPEVRTWSAASHVWLLTFVDAESGAPIGGRAIEIRAGNGGSVSRLPADGRLLYGLTLGRTLMWAGVEGYVPLSFEVEPQEPGYATRTVALKRLR